MKTLIIYATKHGTAEKCARILAEKLGGQAELHNIKTGKLPDLAQYDRIIVGGSIYVGKIQKEISTFCAENLETLKNKKLGLYICCMFRKNEEQQLSNAYPKELLEAAAAKYNLGGEMRFSRMSLMERFMTKMVSKEIAKTDPSLAITDTGKDMSVLINENIDSFVREIC